MNFHYQVQFIHPTVPQLETSEATLVIVLADCLTAFRLEFSSLPVASGDYLESAFETTTEDLKNQKKPF